jgi:hypothetical protein
MIHAQDGEKLAVKFKTTFISLYTILKIVQTATTIVDM